MPENKHGYALVTGFPGFMESPGLEDLTRFGLQPIAAEACLVTKE